MNHEFQIVKYYIKALRLGAYRPLQGFTDTYTLKYMSSCHDIVRDTGAGRVHVFAPHSST